MDDHATEYAAVSEEIEKLRKEISAIDAKIKTYRQEESNDRESLDQNDTRRADIWSQARIDIDDILMHTAVRRLMHEIAEHSEYVTSRLRRTDEFEQAVEERLDALAELIRRFEDQKDAKLGRLSKIAEELIDSIKITSEGAGDAKSSSRGLKDDAGIEPDEKHPTSTKDESP